MFPTVEEQLKKIKRGVVDIVPEEDLVKKLERSRAENRPLRIKLGVDPTAPDIHLGHTVQLRKLKHFQDLGHQVVLIIGDYTAMVGDPSGQDKTRPQLTYDEVMKNAKTYLEQVGKIIDLDKTEIVKNGDWFSKMTFMDVIKLTSKMTVARMLERDSFAKRYAEGIPICIHEFIYALMQGYDSIMVKSDVEIGGTDQTFNLQVGRDLQRDAGMEPQVAITLPMLPGLDGVRKMSKSLGNYIGVNDPPNEMFGKTMSIPDELIRPYFELCTDEPMEKVEQMFQSGMNPRDIKAYLARTIVSIYHSPEAAEEAAREFDRVFREHKIPQDVPVVKIPTSELDDGKIWIVKLITTCRLAPSNSEARRLIRQGAVSIDGEKIKDENSSVPVRDGMLLKVGKRRFARVERA